MDKKIIWNWYILQDIKKYFFVDIYWYVLIYFITLVKWNNIYETTGVMVKWLKAPAGYPIIYGSIPAGGNKNYYLCNT